MTDPHPPTPGAEKVELLPDEKCNACNGDGYNFYSGSAHPLNTYDCKECSGTGRSPAPSITYNAEFLHDECSAAFDAWCNRERISGKSFGMRTAWQAAWNARTPNAEAVTEPMAQNPEWENGWDAAMDWCEHNNLIKDDVEIPKFAPVSPPPALQPSPNIAKLCAAAQAVVDRWDTPKWKDAEPTAKFINDLRDALSAFARKYRGEKS